MGSMPLISAIIPTLTGREKLLEVQDKDSGRLWKKVLHNDEEHWMWVD